MKTRLKLLRKALELNQTDFGAAIHVSHAAIARWETEGNVPPSRVAAICQTFNVNRDWLVNGVGNMFLPSQAALDARAIQRELIVKLFRELSEDSRQIVLEALREVANNVQQNNNQSIVGATNNNAGGTINQYIGGYNDKQK